MHWLQDTIRHVSIFQAVLSNGLKPFSQPAITISEEWHLLGPFTIGTREATWGADPLESIGGFHSMTYSTSESHRSSLTANGTIAWTSSAADVAYLSDDAVNVELSVAFPHVDWRFMQQVYGWAALQWQGWARGFISINTDTVELLDLDLEHILELWIDDKHYFGGDFYGFHKAPILLELAPGLHQVDVRLVRDVRSMGGITDNPSIDVKLLLTRTRKTLRQISQVLYPDRLIDWKGPMSSTYASVVLRNDNDTDVFIHLLEAKHNMCQAELVATEPIRLVPGQSRPVAFQIDCIPGTSAYLSIDLHFSYYADARDKHDHRMFVGILARQPVSRQDPHLITYLLQNGAVSYAVLRPPAQSCTEHKKLPILLSLHGAGVYIDSEEAKHALDEVSDLCAWTLLPSGVTPWSGDDWHNWGWTDVEAAIDAIPAWIEKVEWTGPGVDTTRWLVTGHSNGGQGVWYAATHHPDNIIAAAPISGYSSIENYVPYTFWQNADPGRTAVVQAQLSSYRHELLLENLQGIPLYQQHGSADDNVPPYHSRQMHDLLHQAGGSGDYVEFAGMPHWWTGVMTTSPLVDFYNKWLASDRADHQPDSNASFSVVTANPGDTGSKNGVKILSLITPGQIGRLYIEMTDRSTQCAIRTDNIESFELGAAYHKRCSSLTVDLVPIDMPAAFDTLVLRLSDAGSWRHRPADRDSCKRSPRQHGGLEAVLRTNGTFQILPSSSDTEEIALQVANNLVQYYSADVAVAASSAEALTANGNVISIRVGRDLMQDTSRCMTSCHVHLDNDDHLIISKGKEALHSFDVAEEDIVSAAYLKPLNNDRLELVLWAVDTASLSISARLLPLMTGSGQSDFIIVTRQMLSRGLEGVFAMGFWDSSWCPASTSFFAK